MRRVRAPKRKASKKKVKDAKKRSNKVRYKCHHMQITTKKIICDVPNEHGAMDDLAKQVPCYEIYFTFLHNILIRNEIPKVFESTFSICTSDKSVYDRFEVGKEYELEPKLRRVEG